MHKPEIDKYGNVNWRNEKGQFHRLIYPSGDCPWYINGKLHRLDDPAVEYASGSKEWWVDGKLVKKGKRQS